MLYIGFFATELALLPPNWARPPSVPNIGRMVRPGTGVGVRKCAQALLLVMCRRCGK